MSISSASNQQRETAPPPLVQFFATPSHFHLACHEQSVLHAMRFRFGARCCPCLPVLGGAASLQFGNVAEAIFRAARIDLIS
jgi:hypothetical protein